MFARLLLGFLALGLSDESLNYHINEEYKNTVPVEEVKDIINQIKNSARLHVGMLTISLITCLAFGGYVGYTYWTEKIIFLCYIGNLVIAMIFKIFFSILFDGVVILGTSGTARGGNALLAFECICQNLVLAFWLTLTIYIHARMQRNFNSEPSLKLYELGVPGIAVFFALVWIFSLQDVYPNDLWLFNSPLTHWIVNSFRLLYLLIQLGLIGDMGRMLLKISFDNDSVSLLKKTAAMLLVLVFLFWLQFGLSLGRLPLITTQSYQYSDYFIDGAHGGLVCLILYFFYTWVPTLLSKIPITVTQSEETPKLNDEVLLHGDRGIKTIDKIFMTKESRWADSDAEVESRDVVYSSVVEPNRLKKTIELYKRLNILPNSQVTVMEEEEFYDCWARGSFRSEAGDSEAAEFRSVASYISKTKLRDKSNKHKTNEVREQTQNKNAFYASKYLILDSKENDIPKFLETRPSVSSAEKKSIQDEESKTELLSKLDILMPDKLVQKWLSDNSDNLRGNRKKTFQQPKVNSVSEQTVWNLTEKFENESNASDSTVRSVKPNTVLKSSKDEDQNVKTNSKIHQDFHAAALNSRETCSN